MERLDISLLLYSMRFFFIHQFFLIFPIACQKIFFLVYFDDHKPSGTYPSLEEESLHSSCFIDVDHIPLFEIHVQHVIHIAISLEPD